MCQVFLKGLTRGESVQCYVTGLLKEHVQVGRDQDDIHKLKPHWTFYPAHNPTINCGPE